MHPALVYPGPILKHVFINLKNFKINDLPGICFRIVFKHSIMKAINQKSKGAI